MISKAPRGTRDILPAEAESWQFIEEKFKDLCYAYNYSEIRPPVFEEAELFIRSVGEETDVVKKEMYIFQDRGGRQLALRPEGTAGAVRAYIEHNFNNVPQPVKLFYYGPMFRYDRPQAGRQRQFYQMGIEFFGASDPAADVDVIKFTEDFFKSLGFENLQLYINSVGCANCRSTYLEELKGFVEKNRDSFCEECRRRASTNPLRLLDCKEEVCAQNLQEAPEITQYLCDTCRDHFEKVLSFLQGLNIDYIIEPRLVRGLDYYTSTAFEFHSLNLGAQNSLGGGGRYDDLVELCGGPQTPGVGMAVGVERILLAMEKEGLVPPDPGADGIFLALEDPGDMEMRRASLNFLYWVRSKGIKAEIDYFERSLKAQLKYANRKNFKYVVIWGIEEMEGESIRVRDMTRGEQKKVKQEDILSLLKQDFQSSFQERGEQPLG